MIGLATTVIEALGSTSLVQVGRQLFPVSGRRRVGSRAEVWRRARRGGSVRRWTPIGAEQTASGYEVAWKIAGADQYTVWNTDSSGNYISSIGVVSGASTALQSLETSFHQDLNGDGVIGRSSRR